jgi:hypothetical protein
MHVGYKKLLPNLIGKTSTKPVTLKAKEGFGRNYINSLSKCELVLPLNSAQW